jgi:hypothetical protein
MAKITFGLGCAHTPQLHTMARDWDIRADRDRADGLPLWFRGKQLQYAELALARARERIGERLDMATREAALARSFAAIERLHKAYVEADPDVVVIVGNDQHEIFSTIVPTFAIIAAESICNLPRTEEQIRRLPPGIQISDHGHLPETETMYPGQRELGLHLAHYLVRQCEFDVTLCHEKPTVHGAKSLLYGMPHAYGFLYKNVIRDLVKPQVPVDVNCWHYDNSPSAARCYQLGAALARAIEAWDSPARVALMTTGGLTHFVVDESWDRRFLEAMQNRDERALKGIPQCELMTGTSECKSWIATSAAMNAAGLQMELFEYQQLYRTEGGTGSSCAFVCWR